MWTRGFSASLPKRRCGLDYRLVQLTTFLLPLPPGIDVETAESLGEEINNRLPPLDAPGRVRGASPEKQALYGGSVLNDDPMSDLAWESLFLPQNFTVDHETYFDNGQTFFGVGATGPDAASAHRLHVPPLAVDSTYCCSALNEDIPSFLARV
jgi:hypothetical protein